MVDHLPHMTAANSYPPYDIVKTGSLTYDIQVALAGYSKKDISVSFEDNILKIESVKSKEEKEVEDNNGVLHKGIAKRSFVKHFTIADDVEVKGAELKDGLLKVSLEKIVPDHKKARTISIK
jgi:molecular chaperone IbpA